MDKHSVKKDIPWIHLVRVLACLMVVCLHVSTASRDYPLEHIDTAFNHVVEIFTKPCVPLFFMVTGFLILPYRNGEDIMAFYCKRIPRVWFPLLVWGVVYAVLPFLLGMTSWQAMAKEVLLSPIKQPDYFGGILWYLYILIGIYLFIPFLTDRVYENKSFLRLYLGLWIVSSLVMIIKAHVPNVFGESHWVHVFDMFLYFSGYLGFLMVGFAIRKYGAEFLMGRFMSFGGGKIKYLILLFLTLVVSYFYGSLIKSFLAIGTVVMTVNAFMLLRNVDVCVEAWYYRFIKHISGLSFGIYLCHMLVLKVLSENIFKLIGASWVNQLLCMALTFVGAYALSWLLSKIPFKRYIIG